MRVFYTIHNVYTWFGDDEMAERAACLEVCSGVAAVSGFVKDYFCARSGFPAERVAVIPNGIDFSELNGETLPAAIATRSALGLPEDAIVIAQVSSINAVKHQMGMVGVMEKLVRKNPRFHLLFAGNVIEPDYLAALTQAVEKSSAKAHIHFVPFFAHRYMGAFLRQQVDIFALPTLQEGCSNAVQEAIYCRVPMVLTDVGNARDVKDVAACIVASTAYGAVENLRPHTVVAFSRQKNAANRDALCDAFTTMGEQLEQYRAAAAAVDADFIQSLSVEQMVQRYLSLIFG
jgi:glycosyltransferase involved in cell wall biosynthesis